MFMAQTCGRCNRLVSSCMGCFTADAWFNFAVP
jgi:hypothetical protein